MNIRKTSIILPLATLILSGCQMTPSKRKKKSTTEITSDITSTVDPTSSESPTSSTSPTSSVTPTTNEGKTSSSVAPASSSTTVAPSTSVAPSVVYLTNVTFQSSASLSEGETLKLNPTYTPSNATDKTLSWSSNNQSVASVNNGTITANSAGSAVISATYKTSATTTKTTSCTVTVTSSGSISKTELKYTYDDYTEQAGYDSCPQTGNVKLLIIPIWFTDSTSYVSDSKKESVRSDIQKAYVGTNTDTGWRSVKTFYEEESLGKLSLSATVSSWYSCGKASSYYETDNDTSKTTALVTTATNWYFTNNSSDSRSNYDSNKDGFIDGVMLIYAAADYGAKGQEDGNLWAYCYWTNNEANKSNPQACTFFWASYDFMYGTNASSRAGSSYAGGDTSHCTIDAHTYIHEMGHVFGLEDYYDNCEQTRLCPAGGFSMQDWNMGGHDPFSVMAYGWANPYIPTSTTTITLNDFQSSHDVILLANHTVDSPFDEYLLIELYTPTGLNKFDSDYAYNNYDRGPSQVGIRLWHVDARLTYTTNMDESESDPYYFEPEYSTSLFTNPYEHDYINTAMANSYGGDYGSYLGSDYYDYNLLQFLRNSTSETYQPANQMDNNDLFKAGSTFNMNTYKSQFYRSGKMNSNTALGWSFTVNSISNNQASITVTKA